MSIEVTLFHKCVLTSYYILDITLVQFITVLTVAS